MFIHVYTCMYTHVYNYNPILMHTCKYDELCVCMYACMCINITKQMCVVVFMHVHILLTAIEVHTGTSCVLYVYTK